MLYVDENLCTGCGICVDVCAQGALTIKGNAASIDQTVCTSCGRCVDACLTGAIISVETISEYPPADVPARYPETESLPARTTPLSPGARGAAVPAAAARAPALSPSRLDAIERVLSGLLSVAAFFLDRRQGRSTGLSLLPGNRNTNAAGVAVPKGGRAAGLGKASRQCRRRVAGNTGGPGVGRGIGGRRGSGKGRGGGGGQGQSQRHRTNRNSSST